MQQAVIRNFRRRNILFMPNKYMINWAIWIGGISGIYTFIYTLTPLMQYGVIWMTFVALPIFFNGGAKPEDYVSFLMSIIIGLVWAYIYLWFIEIQVGVGIPGGLAMGISVGVVCAVQCALHFIPPLCKTPFRVIPAMFGAISMTFSIGGDLDKIIPVGITLLGGATLALLCGLGTRLLTPEGNWTLPGKKKE
jgi:hypothetical protein